MLDATVIGLLLLPAVMIVLGERNWGRPRALVATPGPVARCDLAGLRG